MAQGRRKKRSRVNYSGSIGGRPGPRSVSEVSGYDRMAGASPAEKRGGVRKRKRPPARSMETVAGYNTDAEKFDKMREKQRKSDLKRVREIKRRQKAQAQLEKGKRGKTGRGLAGRSEGVYKMMGSDLDPVALMKAQLEGSGNLQPMTPAYSAGAGRKRKAMGGAVMKARGGTFKGVF